MLEFKPHRTLFLTQRWRWTLTGENNRIVAASSEGFVTEYGARRNAELTRDMLNAELPKDDGR